MYAMASSNYDDLVPRPLPKPTQIEMMSVKPVVPDVSLVFDSSASNQQNMQNTQSQSMNSQPIQKQPFNFNSEMYNSAKQGYDTSTSVPFDSNNYVLFESAYTPPLSKKQPEIHYAPKKVAFSPQSCKYNAKMSPSQHYRTSDKVKPQNQPESFNCCCGLDLETDLLNGHKYPAQQCSSYTCKTKRLNFDFDVQNEVPQKQCSCISCPKEPYEANYSRSERSENISSDEFQKTVLKFENMFLKLNYKYSKISENFVSKEELSIVTQKYENQIGVLMQRINDLTLRLNRENCEQLFTATNKRTCDPSEKRGVVNCPITNEKQNCSEEIRFKDSGDRNTARMGTMSPVQTGTTSKNRENENYLRFREDSEECRESREHRIVREHYESALPIEAQPNYSNQCRDKQLNGRQFFDTGEHTQMNSRSSTSRMTTTEPNVRNENCGTSNYEIVEPAERHELVSKNLEENQQLKRMYNNIVHDVKNMMERSPPGNENVDSINFIKKATLEQFRKMGINVEDIEEKEKYQPKNSSNSNRKFMTPNTVAPSDLSLHMHALAMKYISNGQPDFEEQFDKKAPSNDVSMRSNCNNRSIATLEYMERYHLLSAPEQYSNNIAACNKLENPSNQRYKLYEQLESNDRSFLR